MDIRKTVPGLRFKSLSDALARDVAAADARVDGELPVAAGWGTNNGPAEPLTAAGIRPLHLLLPLYLDPAL